MFHPGLFPESGVFGFNQSNSVHILELKLGFVPLLAGQTNSKQTTALAASWNPHRYTQLHFSASGASIFPINLYGYSQKKKNSPRENYKGFFPTCQVRVVRFYVSLLFSFFSSFSSSSSPPSSSSSINWDPLCSVWRAGPQWQLGSSQFSVACWTPIATGILSVQCGVLDPNRDLMSSVWRAGPQPRYCEFSVACWTPTAILRVECGVLDPNRDIASSVWRAGPQPRYCVLSVACWTPTAILRVQCGVLDLKYCVRKFVRKNDRRYVRKNDRRYVRRNVKRICQKICQKECQKICQKICQKECQKICQKECQKICQKEW